MSANTFGTYFKVTSFGESHGTALGVVIDGCPAGVEFNSELLLNEMKRRKPGGATVSSRQEEDIPQILSGVYEGKTLGTPIAMIVTNNDARSIDYKNLTPRAGHADDVWVKKFGISDPRGGGRSSGRETVSRVMAGAVAKMFISQVFPEFKIAGVAAKIGPFDSSSPSFNADVEKLLMQAKDEGKSYGGVAEISIEGLPEGLGQPVFHKLKSDLAAALMSVGATSAIEIGDGLTAAEEEGSEFHTQKSAEHYGGILGGISTGEKITMRATFKPTSSVLDVAKKGRHDPCIVPRAIPVLESMAALVIADHVLWAAGDKIENLKRIFE